MSDLKKAGIF